MKQIIIIAILVIILSSSIQAKNQLKQNIQKQNKTTKDILLETPKGEHLSNHYGYDSQASPYGYNLEPYKIIHQTYAQQNAVQYPIRISSLSSCNIQTDIHYKFCFNLNSCGLCSSSPFCGWCGASQQCLPGSLKSAICPQQCHVMNQWIFQEDQCNSRIKVASGQLTNVSPFETTKLITPQITGLKAKIQTRISHPAVVSTPVLLGHQNHIQSVLHVDQQTGQVLSKSQIHVQKPIVGEVHQVMNVETVHNQIVDLNSGKRLDSPQPDQYHGINIQN